MIGRIFNIHIQLSVMYHYFRRLQRGPPMTYWNIPGLSIIFLCISLYSFKRCIQPYYWNLKGIKKKLLMEELYLHLYSSYIQSKVTSNTPLRDMYLVSSSTLIKNSSGLVIEYVSHQICLRHCGIFIQI